MKQADGLTQAEDEGGLAKTGLRWQVRMMLLGLIVKGHG